MAMRMRVARALRIPNCKHGRLLLYKSHTGTHAGAVPQIVKYGTYRTRISVTHDGYSLYLCLFTYTLPAASGTLAHSRANPSWRLGSITGISCSRGTP